MMYDYWPQLVTITPESKSFLHFLVRLCAVVGGCFAVTGGIPGAEPPVQMAMGGRSYLPLTTGERPFAQGC